MYVRPGADTPQTQPSASAGVSYQPPQQTGEHYIGSTCNAWSNQHKPYSRTQACTCHSSAENQRIWSVHRERCTVEALLHQDVLYQRSTGIIPDVRKVAPAPCKVITLCIRVLKFLGCRRRFSRASKHGTRHDVSPSRIILRTSTCAS